MAPAPGAAALPVAGAPGATAPRTPAPAPSAGPPFDPSKLSAVVAKVNGEPIRREDLLQRANAMRAQMQQMGAPEPPRDEEFYRAMADQLIGQRLLITEAKKRGFTPTPAEVNAKLDQVKDKFPTPADFEKQLAAQGMTAKQVAAELADNLAIQKLVETDITPNVKVSEA